MSRGGYETWAFRSVFLIGLLAIGLAGGCSKASLTGVEPDKAKLIGTWKVKDSGVQYQLYDKGNLTLTAADGSTKDGGWTLDKSIFNVNVDGLEPMVYMIMSFSSSEMVIQGADPNKGRDVYTWDKQ